MYRIIFTLALHKTRSLAICHPREGGNPCGSLKSGYSSAGMTGIHTCWQGENASIALLPLYIEGFREAG